MAKLSGRTFEIDSEEAHICLLPLLTKHGEAPSVAKGTGGNSKCGRLEWLALVHHHNGFGMCSQEPVQAEAALCDSHCSGENKPHTWWAKFECKMNSAHSAIRRGCESDVDEQAKIRNLLSEMRDPSLDHMHSSVDRGARDPNCTHLDVMVESKEEILRKHPNAHNANKNTRHIKQTAAKRQQNHEHQNCENQSQAQGQGGKITTPTQRPLSQKMARSSGDITPFDLMNQMALHHPHRLWEAVTSSPTETRWSD